MSERQLQDNIDQALPNGYLKDRILAMYAVLKRIEDNGIACDYQCAWTFKDGERIWDCGCGNTELADAVKKVLSDD